MKKEVSDSNSNLIFLVLIIGLLVFLIFNNDKQENFQNKNSNSLEKVEGLLLSDIKEKLRKKYPDSSDDIINDLAAKELTIKSYGMNPQTHSMDLSKFVRKSELEASQKCLVENADNKDEYIHKNLGRGRELIQMKRNIEQAREELGLQFNILNEERELQSPFARIKQ